MTLRPIGAAPPDYLLSPEARAIPEAAETPRASESGLQGAGETEAGRLEVIRMTRQVLEGVDFMTRLSYSAIYGGPDFKRIASNLGIDPMALDSSTRQSIDVNVHQQFLRATESGDTPTRESTAEKWLKEALSILTK